jgi:hypothetical protein
LRREGDDMTTPKPIRSPGAPEAYEPPSSSEEVGEEAAVAGLAVAARAVEVAPVVLLGLLVCPPLAILVFLVVAPLLVAALVLGLLVAVLSTPYLLVHHFRAGHGGHLTLLAHRLRHAARAIADLAPHRIVADVRKAHPHR